MEDKLIKQIKTSCPFPLLIFNTKIKYNEVRKASGIAYILLELIEKSAGLDDKISDMLLKLGIPTDLHYIFGKEFASLLGTEIIKSVYPASHFSNPRYFSQIEVMEVTLTEKGKKMFREGAIPTGAEKIKVKDIFFDPVKRKFDIAFSQPYAPISTTCLGEDFVSSIDLDISGMEDYITANPTKMGLKAEERIVSFDEGEPQWMNSRKDDNLTINISGGGVEFAFETGDEKAFFNKYYSSDIMKDVMLLKTKYKFYDSNKNAAKVPTVKFEDLDALNLYIPDDIQKQANRRCEIFIGRNSFGYDGAESAIKIDAAISKKLLNAVDKNAEFALLDNGGYRYFRALNVAIPCKQLNDIFEIQLLVESLLPAEKFDKMMNDIFDLYLQNPLSDESGRVVLFAVQAMRKPSLFEEYAKNKLNEVKTVDEKIGVLLKLNESFKRTTEWKPFFNELATDLYANSVKDVRLDNMIYKNTVLLPLSTAMGIPKMDYVAGFSQEAKRNEDPALVYQAMEAAGFTDTEILGVVNVIEVYMRAVLDNAGISTDTELAVKFNTVRFNLWKLNDMLGIENSSDYTIGDNYNIDEFFSAYSTYKSSCKAIEKYRQYSPKEYDGLKRFSDIYEPIHDLLSIERTASSHPDKITEKYIDEQIARGNYKNAICDMLVKVQYDLRKILQFDSAVPANELIDMAKKSGYIDGKQADALHKLRMCRNGFQHPESKQIQFDKQTIVDWKNIVFSINGGK